jgi:hypothetical protein
MNDALIFASVVLAIIFAMTAVTYVWGYVISRCLDLLLTKDDGWVKPVAGFVLLVLQLFGALFLLGMVRVIFP